MTSMNDLELSSIRIAGGSTHDSWSTQKGTIFDRADGAYKWDIYGNQSIDFWMGHGSLILGHNPPCVTKAITAQLKRGTHLSGNHINLVLWAEKICEMVPSAERVRFCASGTEATLLALRVARAYTGRSSIIRVDGHFHGWHDESLCGAIEGWPVGSHPNACDHLALISPGDVEALEYVLATRQVAALILEPGGGSSGSLPFDIPWLKVIRKLTEKYGTLLIFDEVMSGFRYSPGGVQQIAGILPDITTLSKILCGGLPGAAVVGNEEVMACFHSNHASKVVHSGTFNGNPLSACAGLATLEEISDGVIQQLAAERTRILVNAVNEQADKLGIDIRLYCQSSIFHVLIGSHTEGITPAPSEDIFFLTQQYARAYQKLQNTLVECGIDMHKSHGWVSHCHTLDVIEDATQRFVSAFRMLRNNHDSGCPTC
ncbi:aminotransferase class III-fold pyridoxal phosphate-dependent enzyme [Klebsiella michiganensis]|uniref:Aminotransferase class III-fold pyridoxal phosphate-dependent enzyme n=1 Tax=Klebsiella michiganensis TaxID=1134687 RepID=A0A6P1UXJ6_9ENTR|nr:aminotransferase class III-fold pyridoxal phosphate-dependent enzyme [Klebsiella michiganensis]MEB8293105.1 aminotransferase class III-fold pyridoxal phosphate-dependent enzyme [Klebsiella michiganensis]QHS46670.1 aminotransferase class III-fold pyridoxal phosphate-dependent enzyme [Klebsiella michiganensis]